MPREVPRRLVHSLGALVPIAYLAELITWEEVRIVLAVGIVVALSIETARLLLHVEVPLVDHLIRGYEQDYLAGYALYVIAGGTVGIVYEPMIAVPAMLMLTIGDPVAGLLSTGELRSIKRPHVLGTMFVLCLALAWSFLQPLAAIAAAAAATVADGIKPVIRGYVIDDNLTIPIGAALAADLVTRFGPSLG